MTTKARAAKDWSEETRALVRRIVEAQAYRRLQSMNILGHCLKYVTDLDSKVQIGGELEDSLRVFRELRSLYDELGWQGLEEAVRDRMGRIPYPESRLEFAVSRHFCNSAERVAMQSYVGSSCAELDAIARTSLEMLHGDPLNEEQRFEEYCSDPAHRPQAQQWYTRWLGVALLAFGRGGTRGDDRARELGIRTRSSQELAEEFVDSVAPWVRHCGLARPDVEALGVEVPAAVLDRLG